MYREYCEPRLIVSDAAAAMRTLTPVDEYVQFAGDPRKLKTLRVQKNPMDLDGDAAECRFMHDPFVLGTKINGLYVDVAAATAQADENSTPQQKQNILLQVASANPESLPEIVSHLENSAR